MSGDHDEKESVILSLAGIRQRSPEGAASAPAFTEFGVTTNFSFLRGASKPEEIVVAASLYGMESIGIADRNTLAGVVRAWDAFDRIDWPDGAEQPPRPRVFIGTRLVFNDGTPDILAYPEDREGYGRLCRLLTLGKRRAKKGACDLAFDDLLAHREGLLLVMMPPRRMLAAHRKVLADLAHAAPGCVWLGASMLYRGDDRRRLRLLSAVAAQAGVPLLATNDILYHTPERRMLQDVLTCIREKTTIEKAGRRLQINAERHLKPAEEMARLYRDAPDAIEETQRLARRIRFDLSQLRYDYPDEPVPPGKTAQQHLEDLAWAGAEQHYPGGVPDNVRALIARELALIGELDIAPYFLTVHDIVQFARNATPPILCQGRGSAANSAVCYVLGITAVDPTKSNLLFERFISQERREPPDIDVDFEHERREEVIQNIFTRYGLDHAALVATVIHYRPRSAIRDVGKALGLTEDVTAALAGMVWGSWGRGMPDDQVRQAGLDPANPMIRLAVDLTLEVQQFPRHLSQHVGGFVLTRRRLDETVPIGNAAMDKRTFIEWDKDDIDRLRIMKVDVLALGMLTCIRKAFDLLKRHCDVETSLADITRTDDPKVYAMLSKGDSLGVFQVESRAQMNMLPRLKPKRFYDLVIEVAIVRPGPIQGDMVHPYLKRRQEQERAEREGRVYRIDFPAPSPDHGPKNELEEVLGRTLGVPLFQEQAMSLAMKAALFTGEEANALRRSMATFRNVGTMGDHERKMVERMVARGYARDFAERCFRQIEGFGSYGFPESHAASFAGLVYVSSWLKCHHPAVFACALLNSQPMGFYAPAQIVRDAREHGVEVRGIDANLSQWDNILEQGEDGSIALRLGFRQIDGFSEAWATTLAAARGEGFPTLDALARRTCLPRRAMILIAEADGLRSLGFDRREGLWAVRRLPADAPLPLFAHADADETGRETRDGLPPTPLSEDVVADYQTFRLSLKAHPMQFLRGMFAREGVVTAAEVAQSRDGRRLKAAGAVLVRQRPGSAKGVVFMTIEDETGVINAVVWPSVLETFRREVLAARLVRIDGRIQRSPEGIIHLVAEKLHDRTADLGRLSQRRLDPPLSPADEVKRPQAARRHPRDVKILPGSRDFH